MDGRILRGSGRVSTMPEKGLSARKCDTILAVLLLKQVFVCLLRFGFLVW